MGQDWKGEGRHRRRERILMAKLPPLAWAGKQTEEWLPSTTLKPLLLYPLDGSLWHDFTNSLRKGPASPMTCTGCAGRSHHMWEEDMTFQSLECDFSNADLPLHSFAYVKFHVKAKVMQWFMWACRRESHLREILITSFPSGLLQGVCGGFKITTT